MKNWRWLGFITAVTLCGVARCAGADSAKRAGASLVVYIGTYTSGKSRGIYYSRFDPVAGRLSTAQLAAETKNPSFVAIHPNGHYLYSVSEVMNSNGKPTGGVSAFSLPEGGGALTLLNQQSSGGAGPCHLSVDGTGKCVLVANYRDGSIAALPVDADGKVGAPCTTIEHHGSSVNAERQAGPHAHFILPDPGNRFALVCDLGLDKVFSYRLDAATSALRANEPPYVSVKAGSGPRHLAFHPNGRFVYLLNEMGWDLTVFEYDAQRGVLRELQSVPTLPEDYRGENTSAEVQVHPSGKFVYASNRGDNSIAVFAVDANSGKVRFVERQSSLGKVPRFIGLDPSGRWLLAANQDSDNVVVFRVDEQSGKLTPAGQQIEVGAPVCCVFLAR